MRKLLREINVGDRLNLRSPAGDDWRLGSRRKGQASELIQDSRGLVFYIECVQWAYTPVFDVRNHVPWCPILRQPTGGCR